MKPLLLSLALLLLMSGAYGSPVWWSQYGVIDTGQQSGDYYPAAIGQLKQIATQAKAYLDSQLGLTQSDWDQAYGGPAYNPFPFPTSPDPENVSPVNLGQLKMVASGFYAILASSGIVADGRALPWPAAYDQHPENAAPANIGQLKMVFSFSLVGSPDSDGDGLSNDWEILFGLNPFDPSDYLSDLDHDGVSALQEYMLGAAPNSADNAVVGLDLF